MNSKYQKRARKHRKIRAQAQKHQKVTRHNSKRKAHNLELAYKARNPEPLPSLFPKAKVKDSGVELPT